MTGIKDVAREVGVSTATVSRALRGLPRVSEETRRRVLEVAERLEYVASPHASSLASGRSSTVGVVVPFVTRWFFGSVVHGADELLRERGYDLLLYNLGGDPEARRRVFSSHLLGKRVASVMVLALQPTEQEIGSLSRSGIPTVVVGGGSVPGWSSVRIDDVAAARTAVQHLVDLGHTRIAQIGAGHDGPHDALDFSAPLNRLAGYRSVMQEAGLPIDPVWEAAGDFTPRGGLAAAQALLGGPHPPTAIFAASDEMAIGAVHAVRAAGLRVPEDVSVVGVDDHELAEFFGLTTVAQPVHDLGRRGAAMLLNPPAAAEDLVLPTRLVVRTTTAPPPSVGSPPAS